MKKYCFSLLISFAILANSSGGEKELKRHSAEAVRTDTESWFSFPLPLNDGKKSIIHVGETLFDIPAGKHGFVTCRNGHFYFEDGTRAKFWGLSTPWKLPTKEEAEKTAARLAKFGFNCVRFHGLERFVFDSKFPDTQHLDPAILDQLDYFIYQLKQNGIYSNINLLVRRAFRQGDGVISWEEVNKRKFLKFMSLFDSQLIKLQKDYARKLLTHFNPYTKTRYVNEPAVAMVEIINEVSLFGAGEWGAFLHMPEFYTKELQNMFNKWLKKNIKPKKNLSEHGMLFSLMRTYQRIQYI